MNNTIDNKSKRNRSAPNPTISFHNEISSTDNSNTFEPILTKREVDEYIKYNVLSVQDHKFEKYLPSIKPIDILSLRNSKSVKILKIIEKFIKYKEYNDLDNKFMLQNYMYYATALLMLKLHAEGKLSKTNLIYFKEPRKYKYWVQELLEYQVDFDRRETKDKSKIHHTYLLMKEFFFILLKWKSSHASQNELKIFVGYYQYFLKEAWKYKTKKSI